MTSAPNYDGPWVLEQRVVYGEGLRGFTWILDILSDISAKLAKGNCLIISKGILYAFMFNHSNVGQTFRLTPAQLSVFTLNSLLWN